MSERTLTAGTSMFFGKPAKPMPEIMADAISQVVAQVPGIIEAHLPQCFIEGDKEARQVLVIGVQRRGEIPQIAEALMGKLQLVFPPGQFIDILPFESSAVPAGVRQAGCQIFVAEKKAWWKIW
ncbi:MAG: enhanced serine sensitivity protein SseB C-terminal domain-containing protein [Verrucomicrobiota bacterium]